ncbi:MAG: hypothetical protein ASARMPREDX12_007771 [Alectoria sarmentosa]|nr:MAG: hypothetical protein ASARMPRED_007570 [Alectoria sarmentosa]CAD6593906.1 MAG: hypothetical protein ASARMPREDX12_007771 [Alectoria sarmentosa]
MFCEPDDAVDSKAISKTDPTAPARSAIRRQRTVRYSPNTRDHQSTLSALLSHNPSRPQGPMRVLADRRSLLEDIRRQDRTATSSISNSIDAQAYEAEADLAHSEASQRSRLESGRALLRDALSYERPGRRLRIPRQTTFSEPSAAMVSWRQAGSGDLGEPQNLSRAEEPRSPPPRYLPMPPYASGDTSNRSTLYVPSPPLGTALLTPRFAPAHRLDGEDEARANAVREEVLARLSARMAEMVDNDDSEYVAGHATQIARMRDRNQGALTPEVREQEAAYLELVETRLELMRRVRDHDLAELPRLRRMRRPTQGMSGPARRRHHQNTFDGLGDRDRSFSPDDDQWETMLTTIPPDERVPSAHSSFTSATASSTSLSSNPISSYGTMVTAPSTNTEDEVCPVEYDDSEDDSIDAFNAQVAQVENQANRIEALSQRLDQQQYREEHLARRRRILEREQELQQMEANLHRLERQISEERPITAGRHFGMGERTARERL